MTKLQVYITATNGNKLFSSHQLRQLHTEILYSRDLLCLHHQGIPWNLAFRLRGDVTGSSI
jgi:hypothetical protein